MLQTILNLLANAKGTLVIILPALIAFNAMMGALGQVMHSLHQNNAETVFGKICGACKWLVDFIQGNLSH